jgi:membrane-bound ClpP family serine protease
MVLASVSAATFWGAFFLVLGSVLALFGLVMPGMTAEGTRPMSILAAIFLVIGAVFGLDSSEVGAYRYEHPAQAFLAYVGLVSVFACALVRVFFAPRAEKDSGEKDDAADSNGATVSNHEPSGDGRERAGNEIEEAERPDAGDNGPTAGEVLVQPAEEARPHTRQDR